MILSACGNCHLQCLAIPCTAVLPGSSDEGNLNQYLVDFQIVTVTGTPLPTLRKGLETARASAS